MSFSAPGGLSVQVPQSADLKTQIAALSAQLGMGYLNELAARSDMNRQPVKLAHERWDHSAGSAAPLASASGPAPASPTERLDSRAWRVRAHCAGCWGPMGHSPSRPIRAPPRAQRHSPPQPP